MSIAGPLHLISIAALLFLSMVALFARRPTTAVLALLAGSAFTFPVYVFAQGYNSATFVTDGVLFAAWLRWFTSWRHRATTAPIPWVGWSVAFLVIVVLSRIMVFTRFPEIKMFYQLGFYSLRVVTMLGFFALPLSIRYTREDMAKLFGLAMLLGIIIGLCGLLQYLGFLDLSFASTWVVMGREEDDSSKINTFLLGYIRSSLGQTMLTLMFAGIGLMALTRSKFVRMLAVGSIFLSLVTVIGSHSRTSLVGLMVGVMFMMIYLRIGQAVVWVGFTAVIAAVVFFLFSEQLGLAERYEALTSIHNLSVDESTGSRITAWKSVLGHLMTHPVDLLLGGGYLHFSAYYRRFLQITNFTHGHNLLVQPLAELGILGTAVFFLWHFQYGWRLFRLRSFLPSYDKQRLLFASMFASFGGALGAGVGDDMLYPTAGAWPFLQAYLLLMGATVAYSRQWMDDASYAYREPAYRPDLSYAHNGWVAP